MLPLQPEEQVQDFLWWLPPLAIQPQLLLLNRMASPAIIGHGITYPYPEAV